MKKGFQGFQGTLVEFRMAIEVYPINTISLAAQKLVCKKTVQQ